MSKYVDNITNELEEFDKLNMQILKMASLVEESIDNTIRALRKQDAELAKNVFINDDVIDDLEIAIEKHCLELMSKISLSPLNLRSIYAATKIIADMERIADHSSDISEMTFKMSQEKYIRPLIDIPRMAEITKEMVRESIDAYLRKDKELAFKVCIRDNAVDELYHQLQIELTNIMKNDSSAVEQAINFIMIAKYLEKMADHATSIAEWVVFNISGDHSHLARLGGKKELEDPLVRFMLKISDKKDENTLKTGE